MEKNIDRSVKLNYSVEYAVTERKWIITVWNIQLQCGNRELQFGIYIYSMVISNYSVEYTVTVWNLQLQKGSAR
jgi:hypothetical protein